MESVKIPMLSIIVTAYTTERINDIFELLDSIQAQTFKDFETIFIIERSNDLLNKINDYLQQKNITAVETVFCTEKL